MTYALIGIIAAGLVGAGLASAGSTTPLFLGSQASNMENSSVGILGHVTVIAYDANGNMKSYLQSDNVIVNVGENCITEVLFNVAGVSEPCTGTGGSNGGFGPAPGGFTYLAIGTSNAALAENQAILTADLTSTEARLNATATGSVTMTDSTGAGAGFAQVVIEDTFTLVGGPTVEEYGLFDASTGGNMFARQIPGPTILSASDTLQVTWTIQVGS